MVTFRVNIVILSLYSLLPGFILYNLPQRYLPSVNHFRCFKMVKGRRWALKHHFSGKPKAEDFELIEEELPELKEGEFLYKSLFVSVDPYQRPYTDRFPASAFPMTMMGSSVAVVEKSKHKDYPEGSEVLIYGGWVERAIASPDGKGPQASSMAGKPWVYPKISGVSSSMMLGSCGMPGTTAYFGLLRLCEPKAGEVVVVSGAAGAVGSIVGQIAKIKGCKVIGFAGTDDKVEWLKSLGFDSVYNYKKVEVATALKEAAPNGVDCYFDNVGGDMSITVLENMNPRGRVAVCGAISAYNEGRQQKFRETLHLTIGKQLKIEGFLVGRWASEYAAGVQELAGWIKKGDIKVRETVVKGFENTPKAFFGLFDGSNTGKMVVKV